MARHLMPIDEVPGERLNFDSYLRMEAHSTHTGRMELAFVDTGVPRADEHSNKVMYFDLRKHQQGLSPTRVSQFNALFETLQFPLLFEKGIGGFFYKRQEDGVQSTTGQNLTLQMYTQAMLYQNRRLHYLGRLGQEYALVMHSRPFYGWQPACHHFSPQADPWIQNIKHKEAYIYRYKMGFSL